MPNTIRPEIEQRSDLGPAVQDASAYLQELGPSASQALAEWSLIQDERGRELINLRLSDWTGSVEYRFAPEELSSPAQIRRRLHRLWGDLLQVRSHVQLDSNWWSLQSHAEP